MTTDSPSAPSPAALAEAKRLRSCLTTMFDVKKPDAARVKAADEFFGAVTPDDFMELLRILLRKGGANPTGANDADRSS